MSFFYMGIAAVLPIIRQKFLQYFEGYFFFAILKNVYLRIP